MHNQVKIFCGGEQQINKWLKTNNITIVDIKRNTIVNYDYDGKVDYQDTETTIVYNKSESITNDCDSEKTHEELIAKIEYLNNLLGACNLKHSKKEDSIFELELENKKLKDELLLETELRQSTERELCEMVISKMRLEDWDDNGMG